jgi:hypothetical protein
MKIWGVGWIAGSERKAHDKTVSLFALPYMTSPNYDTVDFPSEEEILLEQKNSVHGYERNQHAKDTAHREEPPQHVEGGGMRIMNSALWIPERAV